MGAAVGSKGRELARVAWVGYHYIWSEKGGLGSPGREASAWYLGGGDDTVLLGRVVPICYMTLCLEFHLFLFHVP